MAELVLVVPAHLIFSQGNIWSKWPIRQANWTVGQLVSLCWQHSVVVSGYVHSNRISKAQHVDNQSARCLMVKAQGSRSSFKWANHLISSLLMMSLFLIFCVFHHHYHFYLKSGSWLLCHLFPHHFILIKPVIRESEIVSSPSFPHHCSLIYSFLLI